MCVKLPHFGFDSIGRFSIAESKVVQGTLEKSLKAPEAQDSAFAARLKSSASLLMRLLSQ